jgi:4-deoxy-L-threo-5-hexosulose-uronate ketol-isomerase
MGAIFFPDGETLRETVDPGKVTRTIRARGERLMLVEVFFSTGAVGTEHEHPHDQATYCLAGEFRFTVQGETRTLRPGDTVFIPGGARHGTLCTAEGRLLDTFSPPREDFLAQLKRARIASNGGKMKLDIRYGHHPRDVKGYDTDTLRDQFLVQEVFRPGELRLTYTHVDRVIFGGAMPRGERLELTGGKELGTEHFLDRRELGIINIGGPGTVLLDGKKETLAKGDGMYVGMGVGSVGFESVDAAAPAKLYLMSCPAHHAYPATKIEFARANPRTLGAAETNNARTIYQYVHPAVCKSCQLVMGMTIMAPGSVWNTFPPHTHERRMEVYLYFGMDAQTRVFHLHGRPDETRHIVMSNEQAVISPSWSIHSGVGTGAYTFIWGMAGENQTFDDMDGIAPAGLR